MTKDDYESLLRITERTSAMVVGWRMAYVQSGQQFKRPDRMNSVNAFIADLAEFKVELKLILKGEQESPAGEALKELLRQIEAATDKDTRELYLDQLANSMKKLLAEGRMEVKNAAGETATRSDG